MKYKELKLNKNFVIKVLLYIILLFGFNINICFGITDEFKFVIDTIGIKDTNKVGEKINEQIYDVYKVFVYSSPIEVMSKTNLQRFKVVESNGKWIETSTGARGEYYILGTDYNGDLVTNVYFPADFVPETIPTNWNYLYNENAINSWNDSSKYKYIEQLEYMKNSNILFDKIDFENNICDSYNLVEYDISANEIGLDKAFLETCSTWTTSGVISIKRLTPDNKVRYASFFVKPMAASANIESFLEVEDNFKLTLDNRYVNIKFGANAVNLNDYAKEEHIKEINSDIYINDVKVDSVKSTRIKSIEKDILYEIPKEYLENGTKILNIKVKSYLYTEFSVDGLLQSITEKNITIHEEVLESDIVPADNILVKQLEKINGDFIVKDLIKTKITEDSDSIGIIEKGRYLAVKINNINVESVDNIRVFINEEEYKIDSISLDNNFVFKLHILENNENMNFNTIATWKYLKDLANSYFDINFVDIGKRVKEANVLKILLKDKSYSVKFDVIDNYLYNMNYTFLDKVINIDDLNEIVRLEEWIR